MRNGFLGALSTLLASTGWALAQPPLPPAAAVPPPGQSVPMPPMPPHGPYMAPMPGDPGCPPFPEAGMEGGGVKYLRNNAFGPRFTPFSARNAFGPHETLPEELQDNVFCSTPPCPADPGPWFWLGGEYIFWVLKGQALPGPTVVSTPGTTFGEAPAFDQVLSQTIVHEFENDETRHNGGQFTVGLWVLPSRLVGIEGKVFFLDTQQDTIGTGSSTTGRPLIAPPLVNSLTGTPGTFPLVAFPDRQSGHISETISTEFWGAEGNVIFNPYPVQRYVQFVAGFRYLALEDQFGLNMTTTAIEDGGAFFQGNPVAQDTAIYVADQFHTRNQFRGGHFGFRAQYDYSRLFFRLDARIGLGDTRQEVTVNGTTTVTPAGSRLVNPAGGTASVVVPGGILAVRSNMGTFTQNKFSVVPEIGVTVGCHLMEHLNVFVGYDFLYWNKVLRPAGVISPVGDPSQIPTSASFRPATGLEPSTLIMRESDFWAQGINLGVAFGW